MSNRNMLLLISTMILSYACYVRAEQNPYARYVVAGFSMIDRWSLQEAPDQQLFEGAMHGMVATLRQLGDEHSQFIDQRQREDFQTDLRQEFGGVGVRIRMLGDPSQLTIIGPPEPGTPAFHADIRSGDQIVAIDRQPTSGMALLDVLHQMRGAPGTLITLSILHQGSTQPVDIDLTRETITVDSILGDLRDEDGNWIFRLASAPRIAVIRVTKFGDKTVAELTRTLAMLTDQGVEALILDMRDNYGGALDAAAAISDMFLRGGEAILPTRGRDQKVRDRYVATGQGIYMDLPVVILINHNSASASEIVAACLQDHQRAIIIGQRSYGKGTVQRLMRVESGRSLLKLTSATYWRPSGVNIHRMPGDDSDAPWGVSPNAGFAVVLDETEYLNWRKFRRRRDLFVNQEAEDFIDQMEKEDGKLPLSFTDRAFDRAVEYLQKQFGPTADAKSP